MIGEIVFPLKRVLNESPMSLTPFSVQPIKGNPDTYDLKKTKLWMKFNLQKRNK
jgi:hypothetical protein